jgi:predicted metal-dependent HD superfamily phosphohydrolase
MTPTQSVHDERSTLLELVSLAPSELRQVLLASADFWKELALAYETPPRAYHNLRHLVEMARWFDRFRSLWHRPVEMWLALLFHDAIQRPLVGDSERASADFGRDMLSRHLAHSDVDLNLIERAVLLTRDHGRHDPSHLSSDERLFLDCDMAILGASPERYAEYLAGVRSEFSKLPDEVFRRGRRGFAERLLELPTIFLTPVLRDELEDVARRNLAAELEGRRGAASK